MPTGREIIQFQANFRGVYKCVYVSNSFTTVDEKITITVKIFQVSGLKNIFVHPGRKKFNCRQFSEVCVSVCMYQFHLQMLMKKFPSQ